MTRNRTERNGTNETATQIPEDAHRLQAVNAPQIADNRAPGAAEIEGQQMSKISDYLTKRGFTFMSSGGATREVLYRAPHGTVVPQRVAVLYARQDDKAAAAVRRHSSLCLDCDNEPCVCLEESCER